MNGFRQPKKGKKSPARNLHKEKGKPVTLNDVIANGCDGHLACRQLGRIWSPERQRWEPCARATKRFYREHPEVIVDKKGNAWHPREDVGPPEPTAEPRAEGAGREPADPGPGADGRDG